MPFGPSKRCREFLEYIVEHTINGPSGTLKERSIGVEIISSGDLIQQFEATWDDDLSKFRSVFALIPSSARWH